MQDTKAIMIQGCSSDTGKSLIVAGLCRVLVRRGIKVAPFKAQNMSNNAAVVAQGAEIGRAQALQARACAIEPTIDMNPILLKPEADHTSQLIVRGQRVGKVHAHALMQQRRDMLDIAVESYRKLQEEYDFIVIEGAGSPAEINLRAGDIANMGFARAVGVPVLLAGDVERGGVIAQIVGTCCVLDIADKRHIVGYMINKFRGDKSLFDSAIDIINQQTQLKNLGVIGWFKYANRLPAEDTQGLKTFVTNAFNNDTSHQGNRIKIAILRLPYIANFDDFDAIAHEPAIELVWIAEGQTIPSDCHLVILPGSKSTIHDLKVLKYEGWDIDLLAHRRRGGYILGICAGYQMLGQYIEDAANIESHHKKTKGLGFLDVDTTMYLQKTLIVNQAKIHTLDEWIEGYQMHIGKTKRSKKLAENAPPIKAFAILADGSTDGSISQDGKVFGTYLHGIFNTLGGRKFLSQLCKDHQPKLWAMHDWDEVVESTLNLWADQLEQELDIDQIVKIASKTITQQTSTG